MTHQDIVDRFAALGCGPGESYGEALKRAEAAEAENKLMRQLLAGRVAA